MADQVKEKARETGQEALDRGKEVARQSGAIPYQALATLLDKAL